VGWKFTHLHLDAVSAAQPQIEPWDVGQGSRELDTAVADQQVIKTQGRQFPLDHSFQAWPGDSN
jgi:hypothetical protein